MREKFQDRFLRRLGIGKLGLRHAFSKTVVFEKVKYFSVSEGFDPKWGGEFFGMRH